MLLQMDFHKESRFFCSAEKNTNILFLFDHFKSFHPGKPQEIQEIFFLFPAYKKGDFEAAGLK